MWSDLGLFVLRVGIGLIFILHGFPKITGGVEKWVWLGTNMQHFGITIFPVFWGFMAACAEFFGGIALVLGIYVQVAAFFMADVMIVALAMHIRSGDSFETYSHALSLLVVFCSLIFLGGGSWSLLGR